jgi:hypothetical protein
MAKGREICFTTAPRTFQDASGPSCSKTADRLSQDISDDAPGTASGKGWPAAERDSRSAARSSV